MSEIVICDVKYELTNNPTHGVVRKIRKERQDMIKTFLLLFKDEVDFNKDLEEEIQNLMKKHPSEAIDFGYSEMDFKQRATISLALNKVFGEEDFDTLTEDQIGTIYDKCAETLGGDVDDFFSRSEAKSSQNLSGKRAEKTR